jgi:hypothetical protein
MPPTTRGPLPAGVYWRRRLAVLSLALVVFLGVGKVLSWSSDGSSDDDGAAEQAGATTLTSPTTTVPVPETQKPGKKGKGGKRGGKGGKGGQGTAAVEPTPTPTPTPTPVLPEPTGPCSDDDVFVTPSVPSPIGGQDVTIVLNLQTRTSPACTWHLSPDTLRLNIVSGHDQIWLSEQCPDAIPTEDVTVRLASVTQVPVIWARGARSDEECSDRTAWALPGFYHARAAVLGGEPTDVQFELVAAPPPTVTVTADPKGDGTGSASPSVG